MHGRPFFRLMFTLLVILALAACASSPPLTATADLEREDRYFLPWAAGESHTCIQPGPGPFSHSGRSRHAVDFKMPESTPIHAARAGEVVYVKEDSDEGGWSKKYGPMGNRVRILHADGTRASYIHLMKDGAAVRAGDKVARGQLIGYSGNTGWSATPHLHFQVDRLDHEANQWVSIPVRFADIQGDGMPGFLGHYTSANLR